MTISNFLVRRSNSSTLIIIIIYTVAKFVLGTRITLTQLFEFVLLVLSLILSSILSTGAFILRGSSLWESCLQSKQISCICSTLFRNLRFLQKALRFLGIPRKRTMGHAAQGNPTHCWSEQCRTPETRRILRGRY